MNAAASETVFARFANANPEPKTELLYRSPFELLVAVILSAQATDISVNKATKELFREVRTPSAMLKLGESGLKNAIRTIGLFNTKARNIIATCRILVEEHKGKVPRTRIDLEKLPGVGRKTANVVLNTAFGEPTLAVDTHIFRVARRTGLATGDTPRAVEDMLLRRVPPAYLRNAHHWLILHGRYVCTARKPECTACLISDLCDYENKVLT